MGLLTGVDIPRKGFDNDWCLVGRYHENVVFEDDRALNRGKGRQVEDASSGYRFQGLIWYTWWGEPWEICRGIAGLGWDHRQKRNKGKSHALCWFWLSWFQSSTQLYTAILDNMSKNDTTCKAIAEIHTRRGLCWNHKEQQLPYVSNSYWLFSGWWFSYSCLAHVVNLGNVDVMKNITKIAVVENATAIWEYDPTRADNHVLRGSLDVVAAIRTLAIKVSIHISHQFTSK